MNQRSYPEDRCALWSSLCQRFVDAFSPQRYARLGVVVAVSGGADSVALLRLITDVWNAEPLTDRRQLIAAHYNHAIRGEHSAEDQRFVAELAHSLKIDFVTETCQSADALPRAIDADRVQDPKQAAEQAGGSGADARLAASEGPMRQRRYDFLQRTVAARGARCLLTAHTADDQVETVLHHLFRGTGPAGLCGIPASRTIAEDFVLLRPLLDFGRSELREGLLEIGQPWREDRSNDNLDYQRNWIRGELLPQVRSRYPAADQAIRRLVDSQTQWHQTLREQARRWIDARVVFVNDQVRIRRGPVEPAVFGLAVALIWDRLHWPRQSLASKHYRMLAALVAGGQDANVTLPGAIRAEATAEYLVLVQRQGE